MLKMSSKRTLRVKFGKIGLDETQMSKLFLFRSPFPFERKKVFVIYYAEIGISASPYVGV